MYNETILNIFKEMKHMGRVWGANAIGEKKSESGDIVEFYLFVNPMGLLEKATFKAFGSPAVVAASSVLIDLVLGKRIGETVEIKPDQVLAHLGELDESRQYVATFAIDGFLDAVKDYYTRLQKAKKD